ncbi:hypothetical protein [Bifidobacterium biavatii]|uniref:Uncharacterized protein n=1 Tax=Bifidobacterium biavatii DSM 23969 TaxID=1437608 RepID=A0A086ZYZ9_9BIFI|nr:hypothetical protein [Bifidobacterium biavatii]KFI51749.1 hypothetical protein BBIA_0665 [Bifidobacterium biavatii DSM 23969]
MISFIEDNNNPFDHTERLIGMPEGVEARIVRIAPGLPFIATIIMPIDRVPEDAEGERVGTNIVMHHASPDLADAQDWAIAWASR